MALPRIDKQMAITLRKAGFNYSQIAHYMGCSYDWCSSRLIDVETDIEQTVECMKVYLESLKEDTNE